MPVKKTEMTPEQIHGPAKLIITLDEFKETLERRIQLGRELYNQSINNLEQFDTLKTEYTKWDNWNRQYLQVKFNYPDNQYLKEYNSWWSIVMWYGNRWFWEEIKEKKETIGEKIEKLEVLLNKADLIPVNQISSSPAQHTSHENQPMKIKKIMQWFHKCAQELRYRYGQNRNTIHINDEYDVQDLLRSILKIFYHDLRAEDYAPSSAWWNSRIDLVLPEEGIIIEVKNATETLQDKELWAQIAIDLVRYENHPNYKTLIVFIYDKWDNVRNKRWLISDIEKHSRPWKEIIVVISPE